MQAADVGDLATVKNLLTEHARVNARAPGGWTALMYASFRGHLPVVQLLLAKGASVNARDRDGRTALMCSLLRTRELGRFHGDLLRLLLAKGAAVNARDKDGNTPLLLMLDTDLCVSCVPESPEPKTSLAETTRLLIRQGANVNARNNRGQTALMLARKPHKVSMLGEPDLAAIEAMYQQVAQRLRKGGASPMRHGLFAALLAGVILSLSRTAGLLPKNAPSGGKIAYVRAGNIWVIRPDGTHPQQLTRSGLDAFPVWSRNATKLAFIRRKSETSVSGDVYLIQADGTQERRLVPGDGSGRTPLWSPLRDELAYLRWRGDTDAGPAGSYVEFVDATGKPTTRPRLHLPAGPGTDRPFTSTLCDWSPDGTRLSAVVTGILYQDVVILKRTQDRLVQERSYSHSLTGKEFSDLVFHAWSPRKPQRMLVVRYRSGPEVKGAPGVLAIGSENAPTWRDLVPLRLDDGQALPLRAAWSPDGQRIAYEDAGRIYITEVAQPRPRLLVTGSQPQWSNR